MIFHVDVNSAFLSWEATQRVSNGEPDLRLIPSAIGGDRDKRTGVIVAKSIPAKEMGVKTGEPVGMALRKCPDLVLAKPDFRLIGNCKLCAKMASDFEKPDKVHTLYSNEIAKKMWPMPVGELFSVGKATAEKLVKARINTIGELAHTDLSHLQRTVGMKMGKQLHDYANGIDSSPVLSEPEEVKGYSNSITLTQKHKVQFVTMDGGYKPPWIAKKTLDDGKIPILPYTRHNGNKERYKPWEYTYDPVNDTYTCPRGGVLRHTTTDRDGKRSYRSTPADCRNCPCKAKCGANEKGQKLFTTHIWQEYLDLVEQIRKTDRAKDIYAQRKETIERVFADAKEKHAMRYTHHRGLAAVTRWVRLKYAAMNLKKLANWSWNNSCFHTILAIFLPYNTATPTFL